MPARHIDPNSTPLKRGSAHEADVASEDIAPAAPSDDTQPPPTETQAYARTLFRQLAKPFIAHEVSHD
jgi:hypothetical protein